VLAVVAILAALVVPGLPRATSRARLESYAIATATLLRSDRNAAVRRHTAIATEIDATGRTVRSGASGRTLRVPDDVDLDALVSKGCQQSATLPAVRFFASGLSCGGVIALTRRGFGYEVRVNWLTGGIDVVPRSQG